MPVLEWVANNVVLSGAAFGFGYLLGGKHGFKRGAISCLALARGETISARRARRLAEIEEESAEDDELAFGDGRVQ